MTTSNLYCWNDDDVHDDDEHHDDDKHHDDDEHHDDNDDHHEHDEAEYVAPAPQRIASPRSLSPTLSAKPRSGGLWPCPHCSCKAYVGIPTWGNLCSCTHLYDDHLNGFS